jgi:hypothetical protein
LKLDDEQRQILALVDTYCKNLNVKWNKFKGDVVCRIVKRSIEDHLPTGLKVAGPNAYLNGYPYELDLIIADKDARPKELTYSFEPAHVHSVIEVKKGGVYSPNQPKAISMIFNEVTRKHKHIKCAYLTIEEVCNPVKSTSKNFYMICKNELDRHGHGFFALRDLRSKEKQMIPGEWYEFLAFLQIAEE